MTDPKFLDRCAMRTFLSRIEKQAHFIYATLQNLPREHVYILRCYNNSDESEGLDTPEHNTFSLSEFYEQYDSFDPDDEFGLYFSVRLDRIDSADAEFYEDMLGISSPEDATICEVTKCFTNFLKDYCEKCLRDNHPFELTEEIVSRYGLTFEEVKQLNRPLVRYNTAAKKRIRAEYEALGKLDFLRGNIQ